MRSTGPGLCDTVSSTIGLSHTRIAAVGTKAHASATIDVRHSLQRSSAYATSGMRTKSAYVGCTNAIAPTAAPNEIATGGLRDSAYMKKSAIAAGAKS